MAKIDLGKVTGAQFRMRGAYSATSTYLNDDNYIDCVTYQGSLFICVKTTTGVAPTLTMTTPWVLGARGNETLTTLAQVQANTTAGKVADALAVRELNSNSLTFKGFIHNGDSLDNYTYEKYGTSSFALDGVVPFYGASQMWGVLLVLPYDTQMIFDSGYIAWRMKLGSPSAWTPFVRVQGTIV